MKTLRDADILVVDDEPNIRLMLRTVLETDGYRVVEAADGKEALDIVAERAIDLMILDLNMPVLDGMKVLEQLLHVPPPRVPRVIVLTAYGSIAAAVKAIRVGASDFLEKPITPDDLRLTVAAVLIEPQPTHALANEDDANGGYAGILARVRKALRLENFASAESLLMKASELGQHDADYFNLLGVIYEVRQQWRLAKKFYGRAIRADHGYGPAQQNVRRMYELETFGNTKLTVALGDESLEI